MKRRRLLSLLLAVAAIAWLTAGSGAFSAATAERGVSVAVVDDDEAYVGYDSDDVTVIGDEDATLVTVENRFADEIWIEEVAVQNNNLVDQNNTAIEYPDQNSDSNLTPGDTAEIVWNNPGCDVERTETVTIDVTVKGSGVRAAIDGQTNERTFDVTCEPQPSIDGVNSQTSAKIEFEATNLQNVDVTFLTVDSAGNNPTHNITSKKSLQTNYEYQAKNLGLQGDKFVAVKISYGNTAKTFVRDDYNTEDKTLANNAGDSWSINNSFNWDQYP